MGFYQKKPIVIEAFQLTKDNLELVARWCFGGVKGIKLPRNQQIIQFWNKEEDIEQEQCIGGWIIKGVKGEFYPCSDRVFQETYSEIKKEIFKDLF